MAVDRLKSPYYIAPPNDIIALGGTVTTFGFYKIHTFYTSGTFELYTDGVTLEYLLVGGGGAGGVDMGGGGGAGGMVCSLLGRLALQPDHS